MGNQYKHNHTNQLKVKSIGIDTYRENIIYMRNDCDVCNSEGFSALTRVQVNANHHYIVATLNVVLTDLLNHDEAGLSPEAMKRLGVKDGEIITIHHLQPVESIAFVRGKMYGKTFSENQLMKIMRDIVEGRYSNIELAAFLTACTGDKLSIQEIIALTKAMIATGRRLQWDKPLVLDKHSVGGLPGNRTSPIVVGIIAAAGLTIPKTSSRAITSPAGTADVMETITRVDLDLATIKNVVKNHGGCLAWGAAIKLSPADDILIPIEKALDIDSEAQMIASVLSKKAAAGSTHVVIDMPVGDTAKVRKEEDALRLKHLFKIVGEAIGMKIETIASDGSQPVGVGIGPALEAKDILAVLKKEKTAPVDLRDRAISIAGVLLELAGYSVKGNGNSDALKFIDSGKAFEKFAAICHAQGAFKQPPVANYIFEVQSQQKGMVSKINNRSLAKIAKLAGAPKSAAAGVEFFSRLKRKVSRGDLLFRIHAASPGELQYAKEYLNTIDNPIAIEL